jgi:hypothetical protein
MFHKIHVFQTPRMYPHPPTTQAPTEVLPENPGRLSRTGTASHTPTQTPCTWHLHHVRVQVNQAEAGTAVIGWKPELTCPLRQSLPRTSTPRRHEFARFHSMLPVTADAGLHLFPRRLLCPIGEYKDSPPAPRRSLHRRRAEALPNRRHGSRRTGKVSTPSGGVEFCLNRSLAV